MIINIPLQIDEQKMEEVIQRDYEGKILDSITKQIKTTLANHSEKYWGGDKVDDGMRVLIEMQIDKFLQEHRDDIIKKAAKNLSEKLARTKRGKEILEGLE